MNNSKKTVLVITGTRAEYGLLRPTMHAIEKNRELALRVLVTGAHTLKKYGDTQKQVLADFPKAHVVSITEKDSMTNALAKEISGITAYVTKNRPNLILVLGDRDESFAGAIVGGHLGIPVAHIHGGDKTGWVVDEYIRHATTKFSHLHLAATKKSANRIKLLGEEPWRIFTVGGPGLEEIRTFSFKSKRALAREYGFSAGKQWILVLHHPTSLDSVPYAKQIQPLLNAVSRMNGEKIIVYPNSDTGSDVFIQHIKVSVHRSDTHVFQSLPRKEYINMLLHAQVLIGNSSMGIIDASFIKVPTVNIGTRQANRERGGNVIDCDYDEASIRRAIKKATSPAFVRRIAGMKSPYGDGHAAEKIVRAIEQNIDRPDLFHKKLTYV